jgi:hypothetical protein
VGNTDAIPVRCENSTSFGKKYGKIR